MPQILIDLNFEEIDRLEKALKNYQCSVRSLYDNTLDPSVRQRCAIEGNITQELFQSIKENYSNQIKSDIRNFN